MYAAKPLRGRGPEYGFERGHCLPDVEFVTIGGARKRLSDFKGRKNLLVILTDENGEGLPAAMAAATADINRHEGHVIVILPYPSPEALRWPFDVVADPGRSPPEVLVRRQPRTSSQRVHHRSLGRGSVCLPDGAGRSRAGRRRPFGLAQICRSAVPGVLPLGVACMTATPPVASACERRTESQWIPAAFDSALNTTVSGLER